MHAYYALLLEDFRRHDQQTEREFSRDRRFDLCETMASKTKAAMKTSAVSSAKMVLACAVIAVLVIQLSLTEARRTKNCGLTCYRYMGRFILKVLRLETIKKAKKNELGRH